MVEIFETTIFYYYQPKESVPLVRFHPVGTPERSMSCPLAKLPPELRNIDKKDTPVRITITDNQITRVEKNIETVAQPHVAQAEQLQVAPVEQPPVEVVENGNRPIIPYTFVPFNSEAIIDDLPVWHDGSAEKKISESGNHEPLLSGELRCTLTAKTPLLPGNYRFYYGGEKAPQVKPGSLTKWGIDIPKNKEKGKQIAEPLRLKDGRVVIPGSALKGMLRHSLSALLSAPMERVGERHFTYRPNLDFNGVGTKLKYTIRPALTKKLNGNNEWVLEILNPDPNNILFVRNEVEYIINNKKSNEIIKGTVDGINREIIYRKDRIGQFVLDQYGNKIIQKVKNHLVVLKGSSIILNHRVAKYKGGIDGEGIIASTFKPPTKTYQLALVPENCCLEKIIPTELYQNYINQQKTVLANNTIGHLTAHPTLKKIESEKAAKAIVDNSELTENQLIYVELTTDGNGDVTDQSQVVSFGHHFRYRWAYTSSIRQKNGSPRPCLTPTSKESFSSVHDEKDVAPERLTGARLFFGYVNDKDNPIGKGKFKRLAGRIAINHAVSVGIPTFLGDEERGYCVPLPILGQPKPSAWEFYLQQSSNDPPCTYGDLPGDPGGDLAGRKFYRHQPSVGEKNLRAVDQETIQSDQATLARFICDAKTEFKFTVRFMLLRPWELYALLGTLQPHRLAPTHNGQAPVPGDYGHKLGLGRPLGMGSVVINVDKMLCDGLEQTADKYCDDHKEAFLNLQSNFRKRLVETWLEVHRIQQGICCEYPTKENKKIFEWHTYLRREYSKLRRQDNPKWNNFHKIFRLWLTR